MAQEAECPASQSGYALEPYLHSKQAVFYITQWMGLGMIPKGRISSFQNVKRSSRIVLHFKEDTL